MRNECTYAYTDMVNKGRNSSESGTVRLWHPIFGARFNKVIASSAPFISPNEEATVLRQRLPTNTVTPSGCFVFAAIAVIMIAIYEPVKGLSKVVTEMSVPANTYHCSKEYFGQQRLLYSVTFCWA